MNWDSILFYLLYSFFFLPSTVLRKWKFLSNQTQKKRLKSNQNPAIPLSQITFHLTPFFSHHQTHPKFQMVCLSQQHEQEAKSLLEIGLTVLSFYNKLWQLQGLGYILWKLKITYKNIVLLWKLLVNALPVRNILYSPRLFYFHEIWAFTNLKFNSLQGQPN